MWYDPATASKKKQHAVGAADDFELDITGDHDEDEQHARTATDARVTLAFQRVSYGSSALQRR